MAKRLPCSAAVHALGAVLAAALLASCGGGSPAYADFANKCAAPRPGIDTQGSLADEKTWLRAWTDDLYLWYAEVPNVNPASYSTATDYFDALRTPLKTPSGNDKDRFHFFMSTAEWQAFSSSGVSVGYGVEWAVVAPKPPREVRVGYLAPNTPAANAPRPLVRGTTIVTIDGAAVVDGDPAVLNAGLGPSATTPTHTFEVLYPGDTTTTAVTMSAASITSNPVPVAKLLSGTTVGYILFNDHIATSENLLVQAVNTLKSQGATELVLDIRYNGGGFLAIASELAYMISGPSTGGKPFERLTFNDKHPTNDPVTGAALTPTPFFTTTVLSSSSTSLPTLNLMRVFVLTDHGTCSASESIINGLRGQNINVIQIGLHTCGKPYGFYPADNCGTTYFSIQFKGVNAKGFGDYSDGFTPGTTDPAGVPGCLVQEGFDHELGDPAEKRIAAALQYIGNGTCPPSPPPGITALSVAASRDDAVAAKRAWRENRILPRNR